MAKDKNQKGSGARKHGRNYRQRNAPFRTTLSVTRYRALHGIPNGRRRELHAKGECPKHRRQNGKA